MKNPIHSLDDILTCAANSAVKSWNYTTGRTKTELSNLLINSGVSILIADSIVNYKQSLFSPYIQIPSYLVVAATANNINSSIKEGDEAILNKNAMDFEAEYCRLMFKNVSYFQMGLAALLGISSFFAKEQDKSSSCLYSCIGDALVAAGLYISSSAEPLPPGKSIFEKAYDKIKESIRNTLIQPQPVYVPIDG